MMLIEAIKQLTARELEVVGLAAYGMTNKRIGNQLGISESTVKRHMHNIMTKLNAANRTDVVRLVLFVGSESDYSPSAGTGKRSRVAS